MSACLITWTFGDRRPSRLLYHAFGGRLGDNRDWEDIEAWADGIEELAAVVERSLPTYELAHLDEALRRAHG